MYKVNFVYRGRTNDMSSSSAVRQRPLKEACALHSVGTGRVSAHVFAGLPGSAPARLLSLTGLDQGDHLSLTTLLCSS